MRKDAKQAIRESMGCISIIAAFLGFIWFCAWLDGDDERPPEGWVVTYQDSSTVSPVMTMDGSMGMAVTPTRKMRYVSPVEYGYLAPGPKAVRKDGGRQ